MERDLPRHDARLLARLRQQRRRSPTRLSGSADLYEADGRDPFASINFITAHDGFTLRDLVSYDHKHNEANLEDNRDGTDDNRSWNCGVEGETDDPEILALRFRQQRNFLVTLLLSQGTPMLLGGDEIGRTQRRQQQRLVPGQRDLVVRLEREPGEGQAARVHAPADRAAPGAPGLPARAASCAAREVMGSGLPDVWWFRADGHKMTRRDWQGGEHVLGMFLNGREIATPGPHGEDVEDDSFILLFNAEPEDRAVHAPAPALRRAVAARALDRRPVAASPAARATARRTEVKVVARSIVVLKRAT